MTTNTTRPVNAVGPDPTYDRGRVRRASVAAYAGTLIEYYDFALYGYLSVVIAPLFFPNETAAGALLLTLAIFGTAFVIRPLGGIVFGYMGDRAGRRPALIATLLLMGLSSAAIGVLPVHDTVGLWAPILLVLARLCQGFSAGGEVAGAATLVSESAPRRLKATYGAFVPMGATSGFALAAAFAGVMTMLTTEEQMSSWGWRVPFLASLPMTMLCLWLRARTEETLKTQPKKKRAPVVDLLRFEPGALVKCVGIALASNGISYVATTFMSIHMSTHLGYSLQTAYWIATAGIMISVLVALPAGLLADRIGCSNLIWITLALGIVTIFPVLAIQGIGLLATALVVTYLNVCCVVVQVGVYSLLPRLFSQDRRYTGMALGWNIGVIIAGGTAPYACVWLVETTGSNVSPGWFYSVVALVGIVAALAVRRSRESVE